MIVNPSTSAVCRYALMTHVVARRFFSFMFLFMLAHQYALSLFRLIAALTRSIVMAYTLAWLIFLLHMLLGGFLLPKRKLYTNPNPKP